MANQTLTTGTPASPINFDDTSLSGLANGETITINGGHLLFDGDTRWGFNSAVVDSMTISSTLGGSILIDGRNVWEVPFSSSTGNVPTVNAVGSNAISGAGVTGELFRVWATGSLTPAAAGGAMPATGWIKLRSKTGDFNGVTVTLPGGATVTCSGNGKRSWIHVVAEEAGTVTVPRLGSFTVRGDWYELGTTNGADDQTFQYPVGDACPAIQIETAAGSGEYEWYLNAGSRWGAALIANPISGVGTLPYVPTDIRGKYFGMDNTTGVITIARRATNGCGYKPPTGCKVRVPNVILSNSNATNFALNTINATLATRYDFTTTAAGVVDIDIASCNWYLSLTNAFTVTIKNTGILHAFLISNAANTVTLDSVVVGLNSTSDYITATIQNCFTSVSLNKVRVERYLLASSTTAVLSVTDVANYTETDCEVRGFGNTTSLLRGNAGAATRWFTRLVGTNTLTRPISLGGSNKFDTCASVKIINPLHADNIACGTSDAVGQYAYVFALGSTDINMEGFGNYGNLSEIHPYIGIANIITGSQRVKVSNIGTAAAPYNCFSTYGFNMQRAVNAAVAFDVQLRRIYLQNTGTSPLAIANTVQNVVVDNVWGDGADSQALAGVNLTARGCRWTNSVTGQSSVYGRHWEDAWTSTTAGRILIACNEPLSATADQCVVANNAAFTSGGQVAMPVVGDEVVWTMPYFAIGVTGLASSNPTVTGTGATFVSGNNWTNFYLDFQYDTGSGFNGSWLPLNGATLSGIGAINPVTGVKLKVRAQTKTASTTNALTYLRIDTTTDATSQQTQYPLPRTQLTITGFESGTDIVIYDATAVIDGSGSNVLATGDAVAGTYLFDYEGTPQIKIGAFKSGYVPQVTPQINLTSSNSTYTIQQRIDRNYA